MSPLRRNERAVTLGREGLVGLPSLARGERVTAIVSSHHARYALLPFSPHLSAEDDWKALARHRFAEVHGAAASGLEIRVSPAPRGEARIACGIQRDLLLGLRAAAVAAGARIQSIQPGLMHAFNLHRRKLGRSAAWLVTEEQARLTIALVVRGLWRLVRVRNVRAGWREELPELLSREAELARFEEPVERVVLA